MMTAGKLRESILQHAMQGRLVEQRPEEGTGEELYDEILRERQRLVSQGKIKKEKNQTNSDEPPFDIPESWKWAKLNDIIVKTIKRGKSPKYSPHSSTLVFAQKCNTKAGVIDISLCQFLNEDVLSKYPADEFMLDEDIVINSTGNGTLGRVGIYRDSDNPEKAPIVPDSHVTIIRPNRLMDVWYVYYCLKYYQPYMEKLGTGSTNQTELGAGVLKELAFPIPPVDEQKRIVAKIEELMPFVEQYAKASTKLNALNTTFPDMMKKSILQEAVQGKLVPQDPNDEPASVLLRRIAEEKQRLIKEGKIKKQKALPEINEDEIPFDIPESWEWTRIGEVFNLQAGKNKTSSEISNEKNDIQRYPCYGGNGLRGFVKDFNRQGHYALIGRQGALCGNVNFANGKFYATEHAVVVEYFCGTNVKWIGYFLIALNLNQYATATAQPGLSVKNINNVLIPLPPLEEQSLIVARIEELMSCVETLEK